ncbi:MAG: GntR family transcriptional regulator [Acidobacteriota bacterium]
MKQGLIRDDVLSSLRAAILDRSYRPGEHLIETELARQFGTSRGPVRDAIKELAQEGLVTIQAHRGAVVATFSPEDILEISELRILLEGYATRLASENASAEDLALLETKYGEMQSLADAGDLKRLVEKDIDFHREVCRLSRNGRLLKLWSSLASQIRLFLVLTDQVYFTPQEIVETHRPILEAMHRKDHTGAEKEIKLHLAQAAETIVRGMREQEQPVQEPKTVMAAGQGQLS